MRIHLFFYLLLFSLYPLFSQSGLKQTEERILSFYDKMLKDSVHQYSKSYNDTIKSMLTIALANPDSYTWPFSSFSKIGKIASPDKAFRIFNWNYYDTEGKCRYCLLIQYAPVKAACRVIAFHQTAALQISKSESLKFNYKEWYGALYYSIIPQIQNGRTYYVLLGFIAKDDLSSQKVIELMYFDEDGSPVLGMPLISVVGKTYCRQIFEYNERITMSLHYDANTSMIVFDHLAPNGPQYVGNYAFYGPDGTYDGLVNDGTIWHIVPKVDRKNTKQDSDMPAHTIIRSKPVKIPAGK